MRYVFKPLFLISLLCFTTSVFAQIPTITSFSPTSGPVGSAVTITGTNFSTTPANNVVWFGAVKATVNASTATQLSVTIPSGTTFQPVSVTVNGLTGFSKNPFNITFDSPHVFEATAFTTTASFPTGTGPFFIAIGDIDIDGKPDLVVTNNSANTLSVFRNTGTSGSITSGSFATKVDFSTGSQPYGIAISDIDGDGKPDIAVTNYGSSTVSLFRNTSTPGTITSGSLAAKVDIATSSSPHLLALGDLDGDGKPDLVAVNKFSNSISVYRNISTSGTITTGSFSGKVDFATGAGPYGVTIVDLDGDGKLDIAVTNNSSNTISAFRNTSTSGSITSGSFSSKVDFATGSEPMVIVAGDIDMDTKPDLAIANRAGNTVSVLKNNCTSGSITVSSFNTKVDFTAGSSPNILSIEDLNGDTKPDLAVSNTGGTTVSIFRNLGITGLISISSFADKVDVAVGAIPYGVAIGDLDGDGKPDLATANLPGNNITVLRNNISGSSLIAWYPFNGNANDASGNGNSGTVNGTSLISDRFGNRNTAYNFNGSSNINFGNVHPASVNNFSLSAWFYARSISSQPILFHDGTSAPEGFTTLIKSDNTLIFQLPNSVTGHNTLIVPFSQDKINNWHHVVFVSNAGTIKIYLDGVLSGSQTGSLGTNGTNNLYAGYDQTVNNKYLDGMLDDIRIYNRVLNATEVSTLYTENNWPLSAPVRDIEGNTYDTVKIGTQIWMKQNLKTTKYNDGTSIPNVTDNTAWSALITPAYCWYNNDGTANKNIYGGLYNWYAVNTGKLCPTGWHMPTDAEWTTLETYLGGSSVAGGKMKEAGLIHWTTPNTGATNSSGFSALSGGYRNVYLGGIYLGSGDRGLWWTASESTQALAWYRSLDYNTTAISRPYADYKGYGFSVRCLKDGSSSGLVASYPFNGNANDESGNENNGTINGAIPEDDRFGNGNSSYSFDGSTSYIKIPHSPSLNPASQITLSAWVNPSAFYPGVSYGNHIISKGWDQNIGHYSLLYLTDSKKFVFLIRFSDEPVTPSQVFSTTIINLSSWYHVVGTFDGNSMKIYINGIEENQKTKVSSLSTNSEDIYIGKHANPSYPYNATGKIDDITIYNKALSATEINLLYKAGAWPQSAPVIDPDGNTYDTIKIGTQTWMKQNLKTTKYNDRTSIPNVTDNGAWNALTTPAYSWYSNDEISFKNVYGALYNWYSVNTDKLCPTGFHAPSDAEWTTLESFLGGSTIAGGKLKETGTSHWLTPNTGATNETGFTALPAGYRGIEGGIGVTMGSHAQFWQSTDIGGATTWDRYMIFNDTYVARENVSKAYGFPVRCIKDDINSGLVASYPFNGNANDESGNGNNGTNNGANLISDRFGNANKAYSFSSTGSISIPDNDALDLTNQLTITAWFYQSSYSFGSIIDKGPDGGFSLIVDNTGAIFHQRPNFGAIRITNANTFTPGRWTFVSVTQSGDGATAKIYINGEEVYSTLSVNTSPIANASPIVFGDGQYKFSGNIDDIRLYNRALSTTEIAALYNESGWDLPPSVTSFTPTSGPVGTTVTITGSNFDPIPANNIVWFGAVKASVSSATETELLVTVPAGASYQPISVTTSLNGLTGYSKKPFNITFPSSQIIDAAAFAPKVDFSTGAGSNSYSTALGDFDGDGKPDLAVANYWTNTVSVFRNSSVSGTITAGSFDARVDFTTGTYPSSVAAADVDGDGKLDIVVSNFMSSTVSVLRNISTPGSITSGSFDPKVDYTTGAGPFNLAVGDLDQDGKPDLAISNQSGNSVSVLRNISIKESINIGSFAAKVDFGVGSGPGGIIMNDIDGDEKPDLIVTNGLGNTISIFRNTSFPGIIEAGSFAAKFDLVTGNGPFDVTCGDIDGDDKPDLAVTNSNENSVSVFRNTSTIGSITAGSFAAKIDFSTGIMPRYVSLGDLDGDDKLDLVVLNYNGSSVSVFRNTSTSGAITLSSLSPKVDFSSASYPMEFCIGDIDGDSKPDIAIPNAGSNSVSILRNTIQTVSLPPTITSFTPTSGTIGTSVIITGTNFSTTPSNNIVWFGAVKATISTATSTSLSVLVPPGASYQPITVTVNGLTAYSSKQFNVTFPSSQIIDAASFSPTVSFTSGSAPQYAAIADIDGDGKPDLVYGNGGAHTVSVRRNTGSSGSITTGSFAASVDLSTGANTDPIGVSVGDLDGDGKPDLVTANYLQNTVSVFRNNSTPGTIAFDARVDFAVGAAPHIIEITEIDGDGKPEIAVVGFSSNVVSVLRNTSVMGSVTTGSFAPKVDFATGNGPRGIASGDFNNDGKSDLAVTNHYSNSISVFINTSVSGTIDANSFESKVDFGTATQPCGITTGDIDGDNNIDIIVANYGSNSVSAFRNVYASGTFTVASLEAKADYIAGSYPLYVFLSDLDGDGKPDLIADNAGSSNVSVFKNKTTTGSLTAASFATKTDLSTTDQPTGLAVGDLDLDGKPDIFTANNPANTLSVLRNQITTPPPTITSFTPQSGPVGTSVTITGTNFSSTPTNNIVWFGAVKATVNTSTATSINVTVPTGATYQPITVTVNKLTAYSAKPFIVTFTKSQNLSVNCFNPKVDFSTNPGAKPENIAFRDIDGDGKIDIVVVNSDLNTISIFRNTSTSGSIDAGSFTSPIDFATGTKPRGIAIDDLNGDGKLDIIVTNYEGNSVSIFRNTCSPGSITSSSIAEKVDLPTGTGPIGVSVSDIDGDGKPEIVVINAYSLTVSIFRNKTTSELMTSGSFAGKVDFATGAFPMNVSIGDIDGDKKPDLAINSKGDNVVSILRNTSSIGSITSGSFSNKVDFPTGPGPEGIALGDLDGDDKADLCITNQQTNTVSILRNQCIPGEITLTSFATKIDITTISQPLSVAIGDLDGDGKPDIAVCGDQTGVFILKNSTSLGSITASSFENKVYLSGGNVPVCILLGDADGDGYPDLIVSNKWNNTISILRNKISSPGAPTITSFTPFSGQIGTSVTIDGTNFSTTPSENNVWFGAVKANVTTATSSQIIVTVPKSATYEPIIVSVNGLIAYSNTPFIVTFPGVNVIDASTYASKFDYATGSRPANIALGDIDNDGKPDAAVTNFLGNFVSIFRNSSTLGIIGSTTFNPKIDITVGTNPYGVIIKDLDGDNKQDLITVNSGSNSISVFKNISSSGSITSGSFTPRLDFPTGLNPYSIAVGDIDSDGKPDLVIVNYTDNSISILRNTSSFGSINSSSFVSRIDLSVGVNPECVSIEDIDKDGKPDIAVTNNGSNTISIFRNICASGIINASSFAPLVEVPTGMAPEGVTFGDLDGDNRPDLVIANTNSNTISVFRNISTPGSIELSSFAPAIDYLTAVEPYFVAVGDIDGDSKPDLAVSALSNNNVSIFKNNCSPGVIISGSFSNKIDFPVGTSPLYVALCDIDGDSKSDLIVPNFASNNFSALRNTNSFITAPSLGTITHPTCSVATGSVVLNGLPASGTWTLTRSPGNVITTGSGISTTITGLSPGTYAFSVTNSEALTSGPSGDVVINTQPATPSAPVIGTITHPTCSVATGAVILNGLPATGTWIITRSPGGSTTTGTGTTSTISSLTTGSYSFTVTNSSSCISVASSDVIINAQPATPSAPVVGTITHPTCSIATGSVDLSGLPATGTWTLTRSPGGSTSTGTGTTTTITGLADNTYTYTVSNGTCTSAASANIAINAAPGAPSAPVIDAVTQPTCSVATGTVVLSGLPASGTWALTKSPGGTTTSGTGTTSTITGLTTGTYTYTVTNASTCVSISSSDIIINTQPANAAPIVGAITQPTCAVPTGSVVLSGIPTTGTWVIETIPATTATSVSGPATTITGLPSGSFSFTIVNAGTCISPPSSSVVINTPPTISSVPGIGTIIQPTCSTATGTLVLNALPASGTWTITQSPGGIITTGTGTSTTISSIGAGTYAFTVTNASGCISASTADVVINPQPGTPPAPTVGTITQPTCATSTGSVVLSGIPTTGSWVITRSPGGTTTNVTGPSSIISGIPAGLYTFTINNAGTCISLPSSEVVINSQPVTPSAPAIGTITQPTCTLTTGSVILSGLPSSGTWSLTRSPGGTITTGNGTTTTISGLTPGTYSFSLSIGTGCTSSSGNVIINTVPTGIIPVIIKKWNDVLICSNLNNKIEKYQWYKGTTPLTGEISDQFYWVKNQPGSYQVLTTDKDGCKNYSNTIQIGSGSKSLTAFPNPARENLTIDLNDEPTGKAVISIFNEIGVKVLEFETEKEFEKLLHELSVETLDEGFYLITVTIDKVNIYSTKIIVAK